MWAASNRDACVEGQVSPQRDDAVDKVGIDEPLADLALGRLLGRQRPVGEHEPRRTGQ